MREILFRGKRPENGEWVYGYYVHISSGNSRTEYIIPYYASALYGFQVYPDTVGQYTGMTDKNGKRIFEGDVISFHNGIPNVVIFENCGFVLKNTENSASFQRQFEVIGNITDNPELLGK